MLPINVKYRVAKKTVIILLSYSQFFRNVLSFAMTVSKLLTMFTYNNIDFLKNGRLNSHKNASSQTRILSWNEKKLLFHGIAASFSEISCHLQSL